MRQRAETLLILGGTSEAAALAARLVGAHPGWRIITSLAGRTREPRPVDGEVRVGGFGGWEGLADYLRREKVTRLIDATHPFAQQISSNARKAAAAVCIPLETQTRALWQKMPGDHWLEVATLEEARDALPPGARAFLALGSQHIGLFAQRSDVFYIVRMVDAPVAPLPLPQCQLVIGKPDTKAGEEAMLRAHGATCIVCRNSGGQASYAKIEAARALKLPVIMIARPPVTDDAEFAISR